MLAEDAGRPHVIDADGHVLEPPGLWERYVDPAWRARAIRVVRQPDGRDQLLIDGRPARLTSAEMLGGFGGMGRTLDELAAACRSGRYAENAPAAATDPKARLGLLDADGIDRACLYPSLGLQWEAEVDDAAYALAHCQAYNRWIEDFCSGTGGRLVPVAHLTLGDAGAAAHELRRAVRAGARGGFLLPFTLGGLPHGHPAHDALFAAACELDVPIALHTGIDPPARSLHQRYDELTWPEAVPFPGAWYLQVMFAQAVQQAFTTFFQYATFDRFPSLRLIVLEAGAGWLGHWMARMDGFYRSNLRPTIALAHEPSFYVQRQCWISGDPDERTLPLVMRHVGIERFVWATDYPHSDHDAGYMRELAELVQSFPPAERAKLLGGNAAMAYGL